MTRKQKKEFYRILLAVCLFAAAKIISAALPDVFEGWLALALWLIPYLVAGGKVLLSAGNRMIHGQMLDETFLMAVATIGAFCCGEYAEGSMVMILYLIGELFQQIAVGKSRRSISALMNIRPDHANLETDGEVKEVAPEEVPCGSVIVVKPGERIPLDGVVLEGNSDLDTSALTGESVPQNVTIDDMVCSGCVNLNGILRIRVTGSYEQSTVARILDLVENAASRKSKSETFITRFAKWYTPCVVGAAALVAIIPPLFFGIGSWAVWREWIHRALIFLVISCPCALVISVPLSYFGGIGAASKCGVLVKGTNYLELLASMHTVVFDKTGTLTKGCFHVEAVHPQSTFSAEKLLLLAASAEQDSTHPIARSLVNALPSGQTVRPISQLREYVGKGVVAVVDQMTIAVGNRALMETIGANASDIQCIGTYIMVAIDGTFAGWIAVSDTIKENVPETIATLHALGIAKTVMLTGDQEVAAKKVADTAGIDVMYAQLSPAQKVEKVEELLSDPQTGTLAFVGDGINDAPVLSRADLGIAMGAMGSDAAIEAADVVLMDDQPSKLVAAVRVAKKTQRIVRENVIFALSVKVIVMVLGAIGIANMWLAIFADVGVSVLAICNAMRMLRVKSANQLQ